MKGDKITVMWAIDYGKAVSTANPEDLVQLPRTNLEHRSLVFDAGLAVNFSRKLEPEKLEKIYF